MKMPINLASHPQQNLRPYYTATVLAGVVFLVLLTVVWSRVSKERSETQELSERISLMEAEAETLQEERQALETWLSTPQVQQIQTQSAFLNSLIRQKSLSWTQMFMDLEDILPSQAQIITIRPSLTEDSEPQLALSVNAKDMAPLVQFVRNLESSPHFRSTVVLSQQSATGRGSDGTIRLDVSTQYRQQDEAEITESPAQETTAAQARAGELEAQ